MNSRKPSTQNVIIPSTRELHKIQQLHYPTGAREDLKRGTNCKGEMLHFYNGKHSTTLYVKTTYLKQSVDTFEQDYKRLKATLKNIIPNQGFIQSEDGVFAFCAPIAIKIDVLNKNNTRYLQELLSQDPKLVKQFKFFLRGVKNLADQGYTLDLYGEENLVISQNNQLYYVDSFLVFHPNSTIQSSSQENIIYLENLLQPFQG